MEWRRGSNLTVDWADKILVPRTNRISLSHVESRFTNPTTITFFFPPSNLFSAHDIPCAVKYWLLDSHPRTPKHTRYFMYPRIFGFENLPLYVSVCIYMLIFKCGCQEVSLSNFI